MSFFIPTARITVNKQRGFEYAMYLVFGSYFKKTHCKSSAKEVSMRINYVEMKESLQYEMEDICDEYADKLFRKLPGKLSNEPVEVSFKLRRDGIQEIVFWGNSFVLRLLGKYVCKGGSLIKAEYRERLEAV